MKTTQETLMNILENDPHSCERMRQLWLSVRAGKIPRERAARLARNIEGNALATWRSRNAQQLQAA